MLKYSNPTLPSLLDVFIENSIAEGETTTYALCLATYAFWAISPKIKEAALGDNKTCRNCDFSHVAYGLPRPIFICDHREGFRCQWYVVETAGTCKFFRKAESPIEVDGLSTRLIPLTQGKYALVDAADFKKLSRYKWHAVKGNTTYYAARNASRRSLRMHRMIMNAPKNLVIDHIDHDGLNNTRANLRICTKTQNSQNQRPRKKTTSRYKGVHYNKKARGYYAKITHKGKNITIGRFEDEIEAAKAYDKEAKKLFAQYACVNFESKY